MKTPRVFWSYAAIGMAMSVAAFAWALTIPPTGSLRSVLPSTVVLCLLAVIAEELSVEVSNRITLAASNLPVLAAIMLLGPAPALVVALVLGAWGFWREASVDLVMFNIANAVLSAFLGWVVFAAAGHLIGFSPSEITWGLLMAGAAANAVHEASNLGAASLGGRLRYGRSIVAFWREELGPFMRSLVILTALGLTIVALYARAGIAAVALLFVPLFAAQYMFKLLVREKAHVARQKELSDQYLEMNIGLAAAMVVLLDSKDEYTAQHSAAVSMYCRDMAVALQLPEEEADALHLAGLLHDLGKVGVPDAVLRKTSALSDEEWKLVRQHPEKGAEVLSHLVSYQDVADIVRYHHERIDGSGYPAGLSGERIPELSKILAVADSYHAMTSDRPYRAARSSFEALKELRRIAGRTLDSRYVEALATVLHDKDLAYRDGSSTDFMDEYERGRINLRLRGQAFADVSGLIGARGDSAAG